MASITKQGNGRFKVRYRTPDGKDRAKRFDLKRDALDFAASVRTDKARGLFVDPRDGRTAFAEYAGQVMRSRLKLRPSTRVRDESYLKNYIMPAFGKTPVARIEKKDVQSWVRTLSEDRGLAPRTVREAYRILGGIMREAVEDRLIVESPCRRVGLPRVESYERRFLTAEQVETLMIAMDARYQALVYVGAYLGLRWGELGGLKRQHLNMLKRHLTVVGSLERAGGRYRYVEETKTTSARRTILIPAFLVDLLARHLSEAPESEYVFPSRDGGHLDYGNFLKRYWHPAVQRAGLTPLTPHELRHTAAALMIDQGANPVTVQRRLGHKDVTTTLQLYGHRFPEQDDLLTGRLEELYRAARVQSVSSEVVELPAQSAT
jgi:integrase